MLPQPRYGDDDADPLRRLQQLAMLRDEGALTAAEFEAQKALVLRQPWNPRRERARGGDDPPS